MQLSDAGEGLKFDDPMETAIMCARAAMGMMERFRVPAHPRNFAIWYAYAADRFPELSATITKRIDSGAGFPPDFNDTLFERFFGTGDPETLKQVGQNIEAAVGKVLNYIDAAGKGADRYGEALADFSGRIEGSTAATLGSLVRNMAEETRAMVRINQELGERLSRASSEVARLREDLDNLRREATVDHLTGLANRKLLEVTLREAVTLAQADEMPLSVLMLDVDHFKQFNDTHGHLLGDQVLKLVARTLGECLRISDTPARYGGEEFVVVLPEADIEGAADTAERIRGTMAGKKLTNRRTGAVLGEVTLSIGVAQYVSGEDPHTLLNRADEALYAAKRAGRNRVVRGG